MIVHGNEQEGRSSSNYVTPQSLLDSSLATSVEYFVSVSARLKQYLNHEEKKPTMNNKNQRNYG